MPKLPKPNARGKLRAENITTGTGKRYRFSVAFPHVLPLPEKFSALHSFTRNLCKQKEKVTRREITMVLIGIKAVTNGTQLVPSAPSECSKAPAAQEHK